MGGQGYVSDLERKHKAVEGMLKLDGAWRFDSPGEIRGEVVDGFFDLISRVASQGDRKVILEHFKRYFASAAGKATNISSSTSWAESDLRDYMRHAADNAPLFIEAFYDACGDLNAVQPDITIPDVGRINRVLTENKAGYEIRLPELVATSIHTPIAVPERAPPWTSRPRSSFSNP
jgi:hypothetical protein